MKAPTVTNAIAMVTMGDELEEDLEMAANMSIAYEKIISDLRTRLAAADDQLKEIFQHVKSWAIPRSWLPVSASEVAKILKSQNQKYHELESKLAEVTKSRDEWYEINKLNVAKYHVDVEKLESKLAEAEKRIKELEGSDGR